MEIDSFIILPTIFFVVLWVTLQGLIRSAEGILSEKSHKVLIVEPQKVFLMQTGMHLNK